MTLKDRYLGILIFMTILLVMGLTGGFALWLGTKVLGENLKFTFVFVMALSLVMPYLITYLSKGEIPLMYNPLWFVPIGVWTAHEFMLPDGEALWASIGFIGALLLFALVAHDGFLAGPSRMPEQ